MVFATPTVHQKEVDAVAKITVNLYEDTAVPGIAASKGSNVPTVLNLQLPDSRFRYMMFCLSAVLSRCAQRMKDLDAVFNECANNLIRGVVAYKGSDGLFTGPVDPQKASSDGMAYLKDFLERWSAWIEVEQGGDAEAAMNLVCSMIHDTESQHPVTEVDRARLWPLASWVVSHMDSTGAIDKGFTELVG